jgi:hypothetical protein
MTLDSRHLIALSAVRANFRTLLEDTVWLPSEHDRASAR